MTLRMAAPMRFGPGEVIPFKCVRVRRIPTGDALDRRFELVEAILLHQRRQFGAEARGPRRFMHDDTTAGLLDRFHDRVDVERQQRAQVENFRVDLGVFSRCFGDMHHRAVGENGDVVAFAHARGFAQRHGVVAFRHVAFGEVRPGRNRLVVMPGERAVINTLGLEEDDRSSFFDGADQEALGVVRVRRNDRLQTGDVGEQGFGRLAMRLAAENAAAIRRTHRQRCPEVTGRAIAQARCFGHELVEGGIDVIRELDFDARTQTVGAHADRNGDDAAFADRCIEAALQPVFLLQTFGGAKDTAEIADVFAEGRERRDRDPASRPSPSSAPESYSSSWSDSQLLTLFAQMRGHLLVNVFEHRLEAGQSRLPNVPFFSASFPTVLT